METTSQLTEQLQQWITESENFALPAWNDLPDFGLYMEQVIALVNRYLGYPVTPEKGEKADKDEAGITAATINNYVRKKVMPEPQKKRYYRIHLAYLIMICTLKQSMSIAMLQQLLPADLTEDQTEATYTSFVAQYCSARELFAREAQAAAAQAADVRELAIRTALTGGMSRALVERLLAVAKEPAAEDETGV